MIVKNYEKFIITQFNKKFKEKNNIVQQKIPFFEKVIIFFHIG